ncbi:unnamed protein product [Ranitomeya imitator]|uniref:Uncharacterized protein n=1 Tax=Ranitomeya imitator TaxID=111125 RepID=A0ABN9KTA0_9NEOB|nr:unnamed protein product [Ranitomeya imitator]
MPAECLRTEVLWLLPWRCPGAGRPPRRMKMAGQRPAPWHGDVFSSGAERPLEREVLLRQLSPWFGAGWWTGESRHNCITLYNHRRESKS